ncbi:MAG: FtsK/SpoIIIE domain-containing protein [Propionicimonas sp.]
MMGPGQTPRILFLPVLLTVVLGAAAALGRVWPAVALVAIVLAAVVVLPQLAGVRGWLTDRRVERWYRSEWPAVATAVRLGVRLIGLEGVQVPQLVRVRCRAGVAQLRLLLVPGLTLDDLDTAAPALQVACGGLAVWIGPDGPSGAWVRVAHRDVLGQLVQVPVRDAAVRSQVPVGLTVTGGVWHLNAGIHTLVAGATGAGKGSLMWSLLIGLGPLVKAGSLRVVGIDLKGGMELRMGEGLFRTVADSEATAVALLEREAEAMTVRAASMAGRRRTHEATVAEPAVLVVIDEAAVLTAYMADRDLARRADRALRLLLTQGRAPGWTVIAFLQDPRAATFPLRDLFPLSVALRLRTASEVDMCLGEKAHRVAPAHRIGGDRPGVGYVLGEDGVPVMVRAGWASDELIRAAVDRFGPCEQEPVDAVEVPERVSRRRVREPSEVA